MIPSFSLLANGRIVLLHPLKFQPIVCVWKWPFLFQAWECPCQCKILHPLSSQAPEWTWTSMNPASLTTWVAYVKWVRNTSFVFRYWDLGIVCCHSITYPILTDAVSLELGNQVTETKLEKPQRRRVAYCSASHWAGAWKFGSWSGTTILLWAHACALVLSSGSEY